MKDFILKLVDASKKHPVFAKSNNEAIAVITEEFLELVRAVNDAESADRIAEEAIDLAITALRFHAMVKK